MRGLRRAPQPVREVIVAALALVVLTATGITALLVLLNPAVAGDIADLTALSLIVFAFYLACGVFLSVPLLLLRRRGRAPFSAPGNPFWGSTFYALSAFGLSYLFRDNGASYELCIPPLTAGALRVFGYFYLGLGAAFFTAAALGPSGTLLRRIALAAAVVAAGVSVGVARCVPPSPAPPAPPTVTRVDTGLRVYVIGVDALDPHVLSPLVARGTMPHTTRLIREGASGELQTLPPGLSPAIWTTIATGVYPRDHGVLDYEYLVLKGVKTPLSVFPSRTFLSLLTRVGAASFKPYDATCRRAPAIWNVAGAVGLPVRVIAWHTTTPPDVVPGVMVSDGYHYGDAIPCYPWDTDLKPHLFHATDAAVRAEAESRLLPRDVAPADDGLFYRIYAEGKTYHEIAKSFSARGTPNLSASYFNAVDAYSHLYWRFRKDVHLASEDECRAWGGVVDQAYAWADEYVGDVANPGPDTVVIVVSDHGFTTASWGRRMYYRLWQGQNVAGVHDVVPPPAGFVALAGGPVRKGIALRDASVLDVAPNVLYLLGLPVASDMPGRLWWEAYDDGFVRAFPPRRIPTYRGLEVRRTAVSPRDDASAQRRAALKALGYLQ